jgi:hypothetical protein
MGTVPSKLLYFGSYLDGSQSLLQVAQKARGSYNSSADTFVFNFLPTVSCRKNNRFKYFPKGGRSVNKFRKSANLQRKFRFAGLPQLSQMWQLVNLGLQNIYSTNT